MAKNKLDPQRDTAEIEWLERVCGLLEQHSKNQWVIGDALLEGEKWQVTGISGKELHDAADQVNQAQKGAADEHTTYQLSIGGHNPYDVVAERSGYDKSSLLDFMRVARAFPAAKRRADLTWSHHQAVAADWIMDKQRNELLDTAESAKLSVSGLRKQVAALMGTDEIAKSYQHLSFELPRTKAEKLEKLAKKENRKLASLLDQAVDMLLEHYAAQKKKAA